MRHIHNSLRWLAILGAVSFGLAGLVTVADILLRFSGAGVAGVVDYVQLFVVSGAFLAMPYTFLEQGHVRVELVLDLLGNRWRQALQVITLFVIFTVLCGLSWYGWQGMREVIARGDISMNIALPMWWFWTPMVLGLTASCLVVFVLFCETLRGKSGLSDGEQSK